MKGLPSRRNFLTWAGGTIGAGLLAPRNSFGLAHRIAADRGRYERCPHGRRISGSRNRLHRRQSGPDAVPLPPATAHGLRLHDAVRLCLKAKTAPAICPEFLSALCGISQRSLRLGLSARLTVCARSVPIEQNALLSRTQAVPF